MLLKEKPTKKGAGLVPLQKYGDFKNNVKTTDLGTITPNIKGKYTLSNLNNIFSNFIVESLIEGIEAFGKRIEHFNDDDAVLSAIETRTSSPIRITRDENFNSNIKGLIPAGEGAGYAGGITSAAIDGMKIFEEIIKNYCV